MKNTYIAIDGTECLNQAEIDAYNNNFWNNAIENEDLKPFFQDIYSKLSNASISILEWTEAYNAYMEAIASNVMSVELQKIFLMTLFNSQVSYNNIAEEKQLLSKKANLFNVAEQLDSIPSRK